MLVKRHPIKKAVVKKGATASKKNFIKAKKPGISRRKTSAAVYPDGSTWASSSEETTLSATVSCLSRTLNTILGYRNEEQTVEDVLDQIENVQTSLKDLVEILEGECYDGGYTKVNPKLRGR